MNVISVATHMCIRALKQGFSLNDDGVPVFYIMTKLANADLRVAIPHLAFFETKEQLLHHVHYQLTCGYNIVHVHNEPNWMVGAIKEAYPMLPVVLDCHDLHAMRGNTPPADEADNVPLADAYVFPSKAYQEGAREYYKIPDSKPSIVLYSMCSRFMFLDQNDLLPRLGGVLYQGGFTYVEDDVPEEAKVKAAYRDYIPIAKSLSAQGIPFAIMSSSLANYQRFKSKYMEAGASMQGPSDYVLMLREMSRYYWGLVGCAVDHPQWQKAMPNKLFECMACGIPVMVLNAAECAEFVEKHGIGVVLDSIDDVHKVYADHEKYRKRVLEIREQFTMDSQIEMLKGLYAGLLGDSDDH